MKCKVYYKDNIIFEGKWNKAPHHYLDSTKIIHREDGPAIEYEDGDKCWFLNNLLHREDGPAIEYEAGDKLWYKNGMRHREDGPAVEWKDGTREWWLNDKRHREDGPAREYPDKCVEWYLNDKKLKTLSQEYLIRYMELTGETLVTLLLHPEEIVRSSVKKYEWGK